MAKKKKIVMIAGAVAAVAAISAITSLAVTEMFLCFAVDRKIPPLMKLLQGRATGSAVNDDAMKFRDSFAERLKNVKTEEVRITAFDGTPLVAHWYKSENAKRTVIAAHGWRSKWYYDFGASSHFFFENDCNMLYIEQRGQGESGGKHMGFGMLERLDCKAWAEWADKNAGELPIYLCGISMGATSVLMAAGEELPKSVNGIMADCGFTSPDVIWNYVAEKNFHINYKLRRGMVNMRCMGKIGMKADEYSTLMAMEKCSVPVLFIHGEADTFVPPQMTYDNYSACKAPKMIFTVPGAGHGMSYFFDKKGYEEKVKEFFSFCEEKNIG